MSKEKQIEEMAWKLCDIPKHPSIKSCEQCGNKGCHAKYYAKRAIDNGFRKATDVAEEIFAEIDEMLELVCAMYGDDIVIAGKYAELKKIHGGKK